MTKEKVLSVLCGDIYFMRNNKSIHEVMNSYEHEFHGGENYFCAERGAVRPSQKYSSGWAKKLCDVVFICSDSSIGDLAYHSLKVTFGMHNYRAFRRYR